MWIALGGLALLMMGLQQLSNALNAALGNSARRALTWATQSPSRASLVGVLIGAGTLNSGALSLGALQLCESGVAKFGAALMLGLSAKAGASLALILSNTPAAVFALPMIGIGYVLGLQKSLQMAGQILSGIGLLLYGLSLMVQGFAGISQTPFFMLLEQSLVSAPFGIWLLGFALSSVLGSANAVGAIALSLNSANALPLEAALILTLGGGAGSGMLLVISSNASATIAKRVARTHVTWKTVLSFLLLPLVSWLSNWFGVAQIHLAYHSLAVLLALPTIKQLEQIANRILPETNKAVTPKYLSNDALHSSELATALALREVSRVGDQVIQMLEQTNRIFETGTGNIDDVARLESKIDTLTRDVVLYLSELSKRHASETPLMLVMAVCEIEHIGDQVKRMLRMHNKLILSNLEFSTQGRYELHTGANRILERLNLALAALATRSQVLAEQVLHEREDIEQFLSQLRRSHLGRLEMGKVESRATTLTHLDLLIVLDEIDQSSARIATISQDLEHIPVRTAENTMN